MKGAALVALLALCAPAAGQLDVGDVEVTAERVWPESLGKGWFPVRLELDNTSEDPKEVRLRLTNNVWMGGVPHKEVLRVVTLEPGERRELELLAPLFDGAPGGPMGAGYNLNVRVGQANEDFDLGGEAWDIDTQPIVVFGREAVVDPELATFKARIERFDALAPLDGGARVRTRGGWSAALTAPSFDHMPREWAAYSSLQVVGVDLTGGPPPAPAVEELLRWVRLGGTAVLVGDPSELLAQVSGLQGAFEERFKLGEQEGLVLYQHGLGRLYRVDDASSADSDLTALHALKDALLCSSDAQRRAGRGYVPAPAEWRLASSHIEIPGLGKLPLRTFMVLLFLFAVVIGPVNLMVLKRMGRPALLLLTIPGISAAASIGLLLYGVFHQGIDTKVARQSLTYLDQRSARAAVVERRSLFVGLSRGAGQEPGAGTAVFPERPRGDDRFVVREGGGRSLRGSFLPVRDPVTQVVLTERAARAHLGIARAGNDLEVTNAFDATLLGLLVRDPNGDWFYSNERLAPGGTGIARPHVPDPDENPIHRYLGGRHALYVDVALAPASYAALLDEGPFADDCGLDLNTRSDQHLVHGVLSAAEEDWR